MKITIDLDENEQIIDDLLLVADINGTSVYEVAKRLIEYDLVNNMQLALLYMLEDKEVNNDEGNSTRNDLWL